MRTRSVPQALPAGAVGPKRRSASVSNAARGSRAARSVRVLAVAAPPPDVRETNGASTAVWSINYDASKDVSGVNKTWLKPVRVAVSGAAGQISNHLLFKIASGEVFGPRQPVVLQLLGSERSRDALEGVAMELEDSLFPLLREVKLGIDAAAVFEDADWCLLIGAKPRGPGMERRDLLDINGSLFQAQGRALNEAASADCKVVVVGNPCNTNALIAMTNAPRLKPQNFSALTRLDENRAKCQLAIRAGVFYESVTNMTIWGNHSTTQVPDYHNARIAGKPASQVITDTAWLDSQFTPAVQTRGGALIKKWGRSSAASTAVSIVDHIKSLVNPTAPGDWFSMAVLSTNNPFGVQDGLVYSFPCVSPGDGTWRFAKGLDIPASLRERMNKSEKELLDEKGCVGHLIGVEGSACLIKDDTMLPGEM